MYSTVTDIPEIETPTFEYFEVFSREVGTVPSRNLYKFFDREGNTLVLRLTLHLPYPEPVPLIFTPDQEAVSSLLYRSALLSTVPVIRDRLKESTQMGVERMGDDSRGSRCRASGNDCGVPSGRSGLTDFQVSVGQVDYFRSLLAAGQV